MITSVIGYWRTVGTGRRPEVRTVAEQDAPWRAEIVQAVISACRLRDPGVVVDRSREVARAGTVVAERVAGAHHAVPFHPAQDAAEHPGLTAKRPREAEARCKVVVVGVVRPFALVELDELRRDVRHVAWLKQVAASLRAHARHAAHVGKPRLRVAVVERLERNLQLVFGYRNMEIWIVE